MTNGLFNQAVKNNPLLTRADVEQSFLDIVKPVMAILKQEQPGRLDIGKSGAVYDETRIETEGFLRLLWGFGPLFSDEAKVAAYPELFKAVTEGILAGTDPASSSYWRGDLRDYDQSFVEMGALAAFLIETKGSFWDTLAIEENQQLHAWLNQINLKQIPHTNWLFFRVLVNTFFLNSQCDVDEQLLEQDLAEIDSYYLNDGWYYDGYRNQIDYYIPFAMQYYGLLFTQLTDDEENRFTPLFKERGALFARTFKNWFDAKGAALPFGRSQTYRFAQSAYWSAMVVAKVVPEKMSLGQMKHLVLANLRYWFSQPIFSTDGLLTVGYAYPNLNMAEGYNAPGSPYWAMKTYLLLALPETDEFWQVAEEAVLFDEKQVQENPRMLMIHSQSGNQLQAFTAGQHSHEHAHGQAKYEKYVYSTTFGFSVPKGNVLLKQGAFDNTLAISETGKYYQTVFGYEEFAVTDQAVYSKWCPWEDVSIKNYIIPIFPWHVRVHEVATKRPLYLAEGGFSTQRTGEWLKNEGQLMYKNDIGISGIIPIRGHWKMNPLEPEPNTNVLFNRTVLPTLTTKIEPGKALLISIVLGCEATDAVSLTEVPQVEICENSIVVSHQADTVVVKRR
jgi:hypothetical protein